ncbi:MAG: aminopeptidase P family protein [Candidatus Aminicenantales bacterium]
MFDAKTYVKRRDLLKKQLGAGLVLLLGNEDSPMNYLDNMYAFRQDSTFLYYFGLDMPGLAAVVDIDEKKDILFGNDVDLDDIIWMGALPTLKDRAARVGVKTSFPAGKLADVVRDAEAKGRKIHILPPYRSEHILKYGALFGLKPEEVNARVSTDLIRAVIAQREVKSEAEVAEIEIALLTTYKMYDAAMRMAQPGVWEQDIAGRIEGIAVAGGGGIAFPIILSKNGQILHNHAHINRLKKGDMIVVDAGAASPSRYAADITRTIPVGGAFTSRQLDVYEIVRAANESAVAAIRPGVPYKEIHLLAAKTVASGLKELGLMKGDVDAAVEQGAHALFFPHGLGHALGLDVHDMENLGEGFVGYDDPAQRSTQFGLKSLRLAKKLKPGFVLTVEPGIYFIPVLIDKWKAEKKHVDFIAYPKLDAWRGFGGIRIEDNVLVTKVGGRILGKRIPKTPIHLAAAVKI